MSPRMIVLIDHLPLLPEIVLLVGACVLMIADLYVKDQRRAVSYVIAQLVLIGCAASTAFVMWGAPGAKLYTVRQACSWPTPWRTC